MSDLDLSFAQFNALYSVYAWPNVVLPFIGGLLVDRIIGIRAASILFAAFVMIGQVSE